MVLKTPLHLADTAPESPGGIFTPAIESGVRRIQHPQGKEARRSRCRFSAPGASAARWSWSEKPTSGVLNVQSHPPRDRARILGRIASRSGLYLSQALPACQAPAPL